jgi:hypothetical protein
LANVGGIGIPFRPQFYRPASNATIYAPPVSFPEKR